MITRRPEEHRMRDSDRVDYDQLPEERTRRVPRITEEHDEAIVNVNQPPAYDRVHHHQPAANVLVARKAQQAVWYFFGVVETLLALRFVLMAVGANPANPFFNFIRDLTNPLVAPFANLVQTPQVGGSVLELGTIFAMIIYLLLAIAIAKLLELLLTRGDTY
jgi:YggT family protein